MDYKDQISFLMGQCFGTADFYSVNLKKLGCDAEEVIANNEILQYKWAQEDSFTIGQPFLEKTFKHLPFLRRYVTTHNMLLKILEKQIKTMKPDILYMQNLSFCPPDFLRTAKKYVKIIVGQIACPLPPLEYLREFDLILTSFPHYVERFKNRGIKAEYFRIGFDASVLERAGSAERNYPCTFVGGISAEHKTGTYLLEELARRVEIDFFGYGAECLDRNSPIIPRHHGEVWGLSMYNTLLSSKLTINRHIDVAENYANNMRLYEATGCGAMLISDYKDNLHELFEIGKEIAAYKSIDELIELIQYYGEHQKEREQIGKAGQRRTLVNHSYYNRMAELQEILTKYM